MKIGRTRLRVASITASLISIFSSRICSIACSIIRMALLTTTPVNMTNPSIVSMSSGCWMKTFRKARPPMPPAAATGTASRMISGKTKLRSNTTISRKITPRAIRTFACIACHVAFNALAAPLSETVTPASPAISLISFIISCSILATACSSGRLLFGRNCSDIACRPPIRRICSGALTISILASCPRRRILPPRVTIGISDN